MACRSKVGKITYFHQKKVEFCMKNHKILILRSKFHNFYFWSDFNECGMFKRFQNYIENCSNMDIAKSPCLKSILAIWGSGDQPRLFGCSKFDWMGSRNYRTAPLCILVVKGHIPWPYCIYFMKNPVSEFGFKSSLFHCKSTKMVIWG